MKLNWMGQQSGARQLKALGATLAIGLGMTACSRDYTVAYVYATSATKGIDGVVNAYAVDYQSGALTPLADSGFAVGANPVGLVAAPDQKHLYVINEGAPSTSVIEFSIGTDGKLYGANTYAVAETASGVAGSFPTAVAIDPANNFLYVTFRYLNGFTPASPGPGGVAIYPITHSTSGSSTDGSLGTPTIVPLGNNPSGIVVNPKGGFVYVIDQDAVGGVAQGVLLAFTQDATTGALTAIPGPTLGGFKVGTTPAGIAEEPSGRYLYVTDSTTNQLTGFITLNGTPVASNQAPLATGSFPLGVTADPRGLYIYVANFGSSTVSAYAIDTTSGKLSGVTGAGGGSVATGPTCVAIEPALGVYLFTSNNTDNSISAQKLSANTGSLTAVPNTPFSAAALPTCLVAVANGAHATQLVD